MRVKCREKERDAGGLYRLMLVNRTLAGQDGRSNIPGGRGKCAHDHHLPWLPSPPIWLFCLFFKLCNDVEKWLLYLSQVMGCLSDCLPSELNLTPLPAFASFFNTSHSRGVKRKDRGKRYPPPYPATEVDDLQCSLLPHLPHTHTTLLCLLQPHNCNGCRHSTHTSS